MRRVFSAQRRQFCTEAPAWKKRTLLLSLSYLGTNYHGLQYCPTSLPCACLRRLGCQPLIPTTAQSPRSRMFLSRQPMLQGAFASQIGEIRTSWDWRAGVGPIAACVLRMWPVAPRLHASAPRYRPERRLSICAQVHAVRNAVRIKVSRACQPSRGHAALTPRLRAAGRPGGV